MNFIPIFLAILLSAQPVLATEPFSIASPTHIGRTRAAYAEGTVFAANDAVTLSMINKDWSKGYAPRDGVNLVLLSSRLEAGVEWQGFRLGTISRNEWLAITNRDTLDIVRADRQTADYETGRTYGLDYRLRGFAADGVKLAKSVSLPVREGWALDVGLAGSLLKGKRVRAENLVGSATATGGRNYTATVDWTRDYSHTDTVAEGYVAAYQDGNAGGQGYAVDFGASFGREDGLRMEWVIADALTHMRWQQIPEKTLSGTTAVAGTFPGGRKWRVDYAERLPIKHSLSLAIPVNQAFLEIGDTYVAGYHFPRIGVSQRYGREWATRLDYDLRFRTWGVALMHRWFYANLQSDSLVMSKAKGFGLGLGVRIEF